MKKSTYDFVELRGSSVEVVVVEMLSVEQILLVLLGAWNFSLLFFYFSSCNCKSCVVL